MYDFLRISISLLCALLPCITAYNLLALHNKTTGRLGIYPCRTDLKIEMTNTMNEIAKDYNNLNLQQIQLYTGSTYPLGFNNINTLCDTEDRRYFGFMRYDDNKKYNDTDIFINKELIRTPNTLYNVMYHEVLHAIGLDHTTNTGFMNYSISLDRYGNVINDKIKLYMSVDDFKGTRYLYNQMRKNKQNKK
jgi:hypothetical protein